MQMKLGNFDFLHLLDPFPPLKLNALEFKWKLALWTIKCYYNVEKLCQKLKQPNSICIIRISVI